MSIPLRTVNNTLGRASNLKKARRLQREQLRQPIYFCGERFTRVPLGLMQSIVMPVTVITAGTVTLIGTCFNIARTGLFVTAKHVIDEAVKVREEHRDGWIGVGWSKPGNHEKKKGLKVEFLAVCRIVVADPYDVALLWLEANPTGEAGQFPRSPIDFRPPDVETPIFAAGYTYLKQNWVGQRGAAQLFDVDVRCSAARGFVEEIHPDRRDSFMINFPSFQANAKFAAGMSGGPVISGQSGAVCGVVCSGMSSDDEVLSYTSYATLAVTMLGLGIASEVEGEEMSETLYDLVQRGEVEAVGGLDHVTVEPSELGTFNIGFRT